MGQGVLANPAETVRSMTDAKKQLQEARQEIAEAQEQQQIPPKHTFSPLPGFFSRPNEILAIERCLSGVPSFTVLFGASSVGKTALLREVLSRKQYRVIAFDLRIAGFADLTSLHTLEAFWTDIQESLPGYEDMGKHALAFKHARLAVHRRLENGGAEVKTSDIAHLRARDVRMIGLTPAVELFQSALLSYWNFEPNQKQLQGGLKVDAANKSDGPDRSEDLRKVDASLNAPAKLIPVLFFDEAHRLPALIKSEDETMKVLLDACLVLTKQDRLCHVVMATSSSHYFVWLRQLNVLQHARVLSIGDCTREEAHRFYTERLLPQLPMHLQSKLDFDETFDVLGGKLAQWQDFALDFANADGALSVLGSSHYTQAYALVRLHLIHASVGEMSSGGGFSIYSPLPVTNDAPAEDARPRAETLLAILRRLRDRGYELDYFQAAAEFGAGAVDAAVLGKLLEIRWISSISPEDPPSFARTGRVDRAPGQFVAPQLVPMTPVVGAAIRAVLEEEDRGANGA